MAVEIAAPIAIAGFLILTGNEPDCPEINWTDESGITWTEELCLQPGPMGSESYEAFRVGGGSGAVPEPGTWGLLVLGFGLGGWALRRSGAALKLAVHGLADEIGPDLAVTQDGLDARSCADREAVKPRFKLTFLARHSVSEISRIDAGTLA